MTRFEEIICSSETARAFMSVCDAGRTGFVGLLYDWQTLIAGGLAVAAAGVTTAFLICQTRLLSQQNRTQNLAIRNERSKILRESDQKTKMALIPVSHALVEIGDYLSACFKAWEKEKPTERPEAPSEAINVIMKAAPFVNKASFESFRQLIVCSQTFESRLSFIETERPLNLQNLMLADIATYLYLTTRLFDYARLEQEASSIPYKKPTRDDLENELNRFVRFRNGNSDPVFGRIEKALDERCGRRKTASDENDE